MSDWVIPAPLSQPVPRRVKMTGRFIAGLLVLALVPGALIVIFIFGLLIPDHQRLMFEARGVGIDGKVLDLEPGHGTGRNSGPTIRYIYSPKELAGAPDPIVHGEIAIPLQDYRALRIGKPVPLVYDPLNPKHAALKSVVEAHRNEQGSPWWRWILLLVVVLPISIMSIPGAFMVGLYFREKRLLTWGTATEAKVIREYVSDYKGNRTSNITYTFKDAGGLTLTGMGKVYLGQPGDPRPILIAPTAVYDPRDSKRNMLYPGSSAKLL